MAVVTFYLMFADDIRILSIPKRLDDVFMSLNIISFCIYFLDVILCSISNWKYLFSFYFILDLISMLSIISDLIWIWYPLTGLNAFTPQT